jgi:hypothetical protein
MHVNSNFVLSNIKSHEKNNLSKIPIDASAHESDNMDDKICVPPDQARLYIHLPGFPVVKPRHESTLMGQ